LKIVVCKALWRRTIASFSCSLATSTCTTHTAWRLGRAKVVGVGAPASGGGVALGVFEPSQMFLNWKPRSMGAIRIEAVQDGLQKFSEAVQVGVLMRVEQPANFGDKGGLD